MKTSALMARIGPLDQRRMLDVGCGRDKVAGAVGIDFAVAADSDIAHDLNVYPWPVEAGSYEVVIMRNFIEHVADVVKLMEEVHRVLRPGGHVLITTPHFSSVYSYQDPTHVRPLSYESMEYFTSETRHSNFYSAKRFTIVDRGMDFGKSFPFSHIARLLFALSPR